MPKGPVRDAARAFYTSSVAQLRAFKETRNRTMHVRGTFDEFDAQRTIKSGSRFYERDFFEDRREDEGTDSEMALAMSILLNARSNASGLSSTSTSRAMSMKRFD